MTDTAEPPPEPTSGSPSLPPESPDPAEPSELPRPVNAVPAVAHASAVAHPIPQLAGRRQFARTSPVVVDRGRATFGLPSFGDRRQLGQIGLVILMVAALGAILLARIGQSETPGIAGVSPSPHASLHATARPTVRPSASSSASPGPTASGPSSSVPPSPSAKPKTYKVKTGDTLSSIAARFKTTAQAIEQLNDIKSPFVIHPGEVLKLP